MGGAVAAPVKMLLWGNPGCGKSTLVERVLGRLCRPARGFVTREIREAGRRVGFSILTLDGREGILAHRQMRGSLRVGSYGVSLDDLEELGIASISHCGQGELLVIDEIGKMECFSGAFQEAVRQALDGPCDLLATLGKGGGPFMDWVRAHSKARLVQVTTANRDGLVDEILKELHR